MLVLPSPTVEDAAPATAGSSISTFEVEPSPPLNLATAAPILTVEGMEYVVEGEEINPDILREPGWRRIRAKMRRKNSKSQPPPPVNPLPPKDIRVVLCPQGGLNLSKVNPVQLAQRIFLAAQIPNFEADQIRVNTRSNFVVVSMLFEERATRYEAIRGLACGDQEFAVQSHIPPPDTTVYGDLFQVPPEDDESTIIECLSRYNPSVTVLDVRRIRGTGTAQILLLGPVIPFWVR